jgi:hypothetical protein
LRSVSAKRAIHGVYPAHTAGKTTPRHQRARRLTLRAPDSGEERRRFRDRWRGSQSEWPDEDQGTHQAGVVTFHRLDAAHTRVTLQMEHEPSGLVEKAGAALGIVQHRIKGDMSRFKDFIEARGREEGGWRGDVDRPAQHNPNSPPPTFPG